MSQQGPILVVSTARRPSFAASLDVERLFPVIETEWSEAARAVEQVQPAAILASADMSDQVGLVALAARVASRQPYLPIIAIDPGIELPDNVIPFFRGPASQDADGENKPAGSDRLSARLRSPRRRSP